MAYNFEKNKGKTVISSPTGVNLTGNPRYDRGNLLLGLLARGIAVFLIVYGSIGCFTSSFEFEYNEILVFVVLLFTSLYLGLIFYKPWIKDIGYILLFIIFTAGVVATVRGINSGFYAMVNIIFGKIEIAFDLPGVMEYTEFISDRVYTITICLVFMGIGSCTILNMLISNSMSIFRTVVFTLPLAIFSGYLGYVPNVLYIVLLLTGYLLVFIMKKSNHYKGTDKKSFNNEFKFVSKGNNTSYIYHSDGKIMMQLCGFAMAIAVFFTLVMSVLFPGGKINVPTSWKNFRNGSNETISDIAMMGIGGFFNFYNGAGGMSGGQLGGVGSVRSDYETDLVVDLVPYSYETVYLKAFTGVTYDTTCWRTDGILPEAEEKLAAKESMNKEYNQLKNLYDAGVAGSGKGNMRIENVGADTSYCYMPYYSEIGATAKTSIRKNDVFLGYSNFDDSYLVEYYPYNADATYNNDIEIDTDVYLQVPESNKEVIKAFCEEANISGTTDEIIEQVADYFQENYPYTTRPGRLPSDEDFVNYFLSNNKKGYCAHFASAATLIFRYMGIPARYVEGYVIPYDTMTDGTVLEAADYNNWYSGDNALGETAVVEVEVDDSKAHAWVEVYDETFGWRVVDVTPTTSDEEENADFWSIVSGNFSLGGGSNSQATNVSRITISRFSVFIFAILVIGGLYLLYKLICRLILAIKRHRSFNTNDLNLNVVNRYAYICEILRKNSNLFAIEVSHLNQVMWMKDNFSIDMDVYKVVDILHRTFYSNENVAELDYKYICEILLIIKKYIKKNRKVIKTL